MRAVLFANLIWTDLEVAVEVEPWENAIRAMTLNSAVVPTTCVPLKDRWAKDAKPSKVLL